MLLKRASMGLRILSHCRVLVVGLVVGCNGCSAQTRACYTDFPVFDPVGNMLSFNIVSVSPEENEDTNLLKSEIGGYQIEGRGGRLYFGKELIGSRTLVVALEDSRGQRVRTVVALLDCRQRVSLRFGDSDSGADARWTRVDGRLSGCHLEGNWWIRAAPMFGDYAPPESDHSYVSKDDGSFWFAAKGGYRHVVIVGNGRHVVASFAVDIDRGSRNDVGTIDLTRQCRELRVE